MPKLCTPCATTSARRSARRFLSTGGIITTHGDQITIRLNRRTYSPILRQATLPETITVPWWGNQTLRDEYA
jgi:hypothetical protein